jgi:hypothetical protein
LLRQAEADGGISGMARAATTSETAAQKILLINARISHIQQNYRHEAKSNLFSGPILSRIFHPNLAFTAHL